MRVNNKLFPYPVLNNNKELSDYKEKVTFELIFDQSENLLVDKNLKLCNVFIHSDDNYLNYLSENGKVKGILVAECPNSIFRQKYEITSKPQDIIIPIENFSGEVQLSAFFYAAEGIDDYVNPNFASDYSGYHFSVEKYCILAVDDTLHVDVDNQPEDDNKNASIFTIVCAKDSQEDVMRCSSNSSTGKIDILMPQESYDDYITIKSSGSLLLNASFATIAIPVLTERIMAIQNIIQKDPDYSIEDICNDNKWFRVVMKAFKRVKDKELTIEYIRNEMHPMELSQIILNNSTCKGISDLSNLIKHGSNSGEEGLQDE